MMSSCLLQRDVRDVRERDVFRVSCFWLPADKTELVTCFSGLIIYYIVIILVCYYTTHVGRVESVQSGLRMSNTPPRERMSRLYHSLHRDRERGCIKQDSHQPPLPKHSGHMTWKHSGVTSTWLVFCLGLENLFGRQTHPSRKFSQENQTHTLQLGFFNPNLFVLKYSENEFVHNLADIFSSCSDQSVSRR